MIPQLRRAHNRVAPDSEARKTPTLVRGARLLEVQEHDLHGGEKHHLRRLIAAFEPRLQRRLRDAEMGR